jgi:hypothetical protein
MAVEENFEKLNERKKDYQTVDDDTILTLKDYYKIEDHEELLKYVKKTGMKGDIPNEKAKASAGDAAGK